MSKYQVMAAPGDFDARRATQPDNATKIERAAEKKIRGMNAARALGQEQEQVYLRAMKFAHGREEESRETNYKLETENRKQLIDANTKDFKNEIAMADSVRSQQPAKGLMEQLAPLIPKAAEMLGEMRQQQDKQKRDAATVAAYQHGFTLDTLQNILKLNDQLTLAQFQATEYIQGLSEQGWSEDRINALYEDQYLTRGSKAWVDNKALAINSIVDYETGLATHVANMQELTPGQQVLEVRNYTQDWLTKVNINGRPLSAEVMGTVISPKVRSTETRFLREIQKEQIADRESELTSDFRKGMHVLFKDSGSSAVLQEMSRNPSADKRKKTLDYFMDAHKSGALTDDELLTFANTKFLHNNKNQTIGEHFIDDATADFGTYIKNVEKDQISDMRSRKLQLQTLARSTVIEEYNQGISEGLPWDEDRYQALMDRGREIAGADFSSPALEALKGQLPAAIINRQSYDALEQMIDAGQGEEAITIFGAPTSVTHQEKNGMPSLIQRARLNDKARNNPKSKDHLRTLHKHIGQDPSVKNSPLAKDNSYFEYEKMYRTKQYKDEFFKRLKENGGVVNEAADFAFAYVKQDIDEYLADLEGRGGRLNRLEEDAKEHQESEAALLNYRADLRRTRRLKQGRETLAYVITEERFMEATQAMKTPGGQIPPGFKLAAETFRMTPITLQQYIAPVWGEKPLDTSNSSYQAMLDNLPEQKLALITNPYGSPARLQRAMADRYSLQSAAVRQSMPQTNDQYNTNRVIGDINIDALRDAVIAKESGGDSTARNADSGALGKGQILPSNIPSWSKEALGREVSLQEFRNNPGIQMAIINHRFLRMANDIIGAGYSGDEAIRRIAAIWYSGKHELYDYRGEERGAKTGTEYPTIQDYTLNVLDRYKGRI